MIRRSLRACAGALGSLALASLAAAEAPPPDDPAFPEQWALEQPSDADIDLLGAWAFTRGSGAVVIAVLDTGLDAGHGDFADSARLVPGYDFVNGDDDPADDHSHGTWMAGIAAAGADDGLGIAGVCPGCSLMPVKVLDRFNEGAADCSGWADGIVFAVDAGAAVINLSAGTPDDCPLLREAVAYATQRGVPIVAAMHNNDTDLPFYPAAYPETIAVGASDRLDRRWPSSNHGAWLDLVAPGEDILAPLIGSLDEVVAQSGTSQAAAMVSGTVGLLLSLEPGLGIEELRAILRDSAEDRVGSPDEDVAGVDPYHGAGRLNAAQAMRVLTASDDVDDDGFVTADDCDDRSAAVHPGAPERPGNGRDDDCDPSTPDTLPSDDLEPTDLDAVDLAELDARTGGGGSDCDGCVLVDTAASRNGSRRVPVLLVLAVLAGGLALRRRPARRESSRELRTRAMNPAQGLRTRQSAPGPVQPLSPCSPLLPSLPIGTLTRASDEGREGRTGRTGRTGRAGRKAASQTIAIP